MLFDKKNQINEDAIQDEIRKRILKESQKRGSLKDSQEATRATLDALEEMVSLSREEMETIAEQVRAEFKEKNKPPEPKPKGQKIVPWIALILIIVTFYLVRRGSSWYLFTGLIVLFAFLNHFFRKPPSNDDEKDS